MKQKVFWALVPFLFGASSVHAEGPIIRSGDSVAVESNQVLNGDFYAFGENVTLSGKAEHDMYVLGAKVTINAPIAEDLTVVGGAIDVHGSVGDDVRVLGGDVIIAEPVMGDLVVMGGKVTILSTGSVKGDVVFYGSELLIDGRVEGALFGLGESVRVDAPIGGDIDMTIGSSLTIGDRGEIGGDIRYRSASEIVRAPNAVINGTVSRDSHDRESLPPTHPYAFLLMNLLVAAFSGLTFFFVFRSYGTRIIEACVAGYGRFGLIGLGMFFALPLLSLVLIVSGIGSFVGGTLMIGYGVLLMLSFMSVPLIVGALIQRALRLGKALTIFTVLLGACASVAISLIPVLGFISLFLMVLIALGGMCVLLYRIMKGDIRRVVEIHDDTKAS